VVALQQHRDDESCEIIECLADARSNLDTIIPVTVPPGSVGRTLLMEAARENSLSALRALLQHGASVNIADDLGKIALHHAAYMFPDVANALLNAQANANQTDREGRTALHLALTMSSDDTLEQLRATLLSHGFVETAELKHLRSERTRLEAMEHARENAPPPMMCDNYP